MFHKRQPVNETFNAGLAGAGVGLLASAVQNSLQKHKAGALGIFTRTGGTIALCSTSARLVFSNEYSVGWWSFHVC